MSDEVELPPLDADPDEWADKWDEPTTITVDRWVKAHLDHDRDNQPWNEYLERLRQHKADPLTFTNVEQIADELKRQFVEEAVTVDFPTADVKEALRQVLREELPEGALR